MRRREVVFAFAGVLACGGSTQADPPDADDGWIEVPLAEVPALRQVGASAVVRRPEDLLDVQVIRLETRVAAVWHLCTHGSCEVEVRSDEGVLQCPCHGARFDLDGEVLRGPATRPLRRFEAVISGDSLYLRR
jgi:Rieske Fe-S protein